MVKNYSKLIVYGSVALIIVVGGVMYFRAKAPSTVYDTAVVDRGVVAEEVSSTGSIAPSSKIKLQAEASGKVRQVAVEEGATVVEGDLIVEIDARDIESQILGQRAALATAAAKLNELEAGPTSEELALAERAVDTAKSRLSAAQSAYQDAVTSLSNTEKKLENSVAKTDALIESKLTTFISDLDDAAIKADDAISRLTSPMYTSQNFLTFTSSSAQEKANAEGTRGAAKEAVTAIKNAATSVKTNGSTLNVHTQYAVAAMNLSTVKTHVEYSIDVLNYAAGVADATLASYKLNANSALSSTSSAITKLQADNADLDLQERLNEAEVTNAEIAVADMDAAVNAAERSVETNENALAEAEASLALKVSGVRPQTINAQRAVVAAEQARLSGLQTELEKRHIVAPVDGTVTLIAVEVGESVQIGGQVAVMNAKGNLEIISNISEIDIARVKIGDPVDITLDAFSVDQHWDGKIIAIQPAETVVDNVIFYETRIRFKEEDERVRSGMTANLAIITETKDGVLRVPTRALKEDDGRVFVEVLLDQNIVTEKDVTVGLRTIDFAEIITGLKEGEEVVVSTREE